MNSQWDLSILYTGFDDPKFKADMEGFDKAIADVIAFSENYSSLGKEELLVKYIETSMHLSSLAEKLFIYSNLRYSANTEDGEAASTMGVLMGKLSATAASSAALNKMIASIENLESLIFENEDLREYEFYLTQIKEASKHLLTDAEEALFAEMNISGASAWSDLQSSLTSTLKVDYNGEKITLPAVRNLAYEADAEVRKDAYEAGLASYEQIKTATAVLKKKIQKNKRRLSK